MPGRKGRAARMREGIALRVEETESGTRLDRFLRARLPGVPSRSVRFAIGAGEVRVDGEKGGKGRPLFTGEKGTLAGYLLRMFPFVAELSGSPGLTLLTRLDYATSGAIPAALTPEALDFLSRAREEGEIRKT